MRTVKARERKSEPPVLQEEVWVNVHRQADSIQRVSGEFGGRNDAKKWCDVLTTLARWREKGAFL